MDDADLQALLEDGKKEPEVCNCTAKCQAGAVNTACPVCKNNLTACNGPEPKPQPEEEKPQEEKPSGMGGLVVFFVVVLLGGGASVVSRHLSPKDGLCKTIFLLDDKVNAVGFERALTAVSRRKSEV